MTSPVRSCTFPHGVRRGARVSLLVVAVVTALLSTLARPAAASEVRPTLHDRVDSSITQAVVRDGDGSARSLAAVRAAAEDGDFPEGNGDLVVEFPTDVPQADLQARVDAQNITNIGTDVAASIRSYAATSGVAAAAVDGSIPSFTGRIEAVAGALRFTVPRSQVGISNWWQGALAAILGAAAGLLAATIMFIGLTALGPAGAAVASRVAIPVFGFFTGFVGSLLKNAFTGTPIGLNTTPWIDAVEAGLIGGLGAAAIQALDIYLLNNAALLIQRVNAAVGAAVERLTYFFTLVMTLIRSGVSITTRVYLYTLGERMPGLLARAGLRAGAAYTSVDLRVEPLGDSITAGYQSTSGNGYRKRFYDELDPLNGNLDLVGLAAPSGTMADKDNEGHSTYTIDQISALTDASLRATRPNVVTLLAGTNNLGGAGETPQVAAAKLAGLVDKILASDPDIRIVLGEVPVSSDAAFQSKVEVYNRAVSDLQAARAPRVALADTSDLQPADMADSLHPNDAGYDKLGRDFAAGVQALVVTNNAKAPAPAPAGGGGHQRVFGPAPGPGAWVAQGQIAWDADARGADVRWADMDGDGKADYLWVGDNGSVYGWLNRGRAGAPGFIKIGLFATKAGASKNSVRLADIDGDGKADYLVVGDHGQVYASLNQGQGADGRWTWRPIGEIALGIAPGDQIQFADLSGDGRAEYLAVNPTSGAVECYVNGGEKPGGWNWGRAGIIASGIGVPGANARFADINSDGFADYLGVSAVDGKVRGFLSGGQAPGGVRADGTGPWYWFDQGQVAPGVGAPSLDNYVLEADVDGDGRADYLSVNKDGATSAWLNAGKDTSPVAGWLPRGQIAGGTGNAIVRYADINGDHRADYLSYNEENGTLSGYLNGGPTPGGWAWDDLGDITPQLVGFRGGSSDLPYFADVNGDGKADFTLINPDGTAKVALSGGRASTGWTWQVAVLHGQDYTFKGELDVNPYGYALGDLDGDHKADYLKIAQAGDGWVYAELNKGQTGPTSWNWAPVSNAIANQQGVDAADVAFADLNGDAKADYVVLTGSGSARAFLSTGVGTWNPRGQIIGSPAASDEHVIWADMNGDGRDDYLLVKPNGQTRLWLNNGTDNP